MGGWKLWGDLAGDKNLGKAGDCLVVALIAAWIAGALAVIVGGVDGGYTSFWKMLRSGESFAWAWEAAWTALTLAMKAAEVGEAWGVWEEGGYPAVGKTLRSGDSLAWAATAAFTAWMEL